MWQYTRIVNVVVPCYQLVALYKKFVTIEDFSFTNVTYDRLKLSMPCRWDMPSTMDNRNNKLSIENCDYVSWQIGGNFVEQQDAWSDAWSEMTCRIRYLDWDDVNMVPRPILDKMTTSYPGWRSRLTQLCSIIWDIVHRVVTVKCLICCSYITLLQQIVNFEMSTKAAVLIIIRKQEVGYCA